MNTTSEIMLKLENKVFDTRFVDYRTMKGSDIDLAFITTNTVGNRKHPQDPAG